MIELHGRKLCLMKGRIKMGKLIHAAQSPPRYYCLNDSQKVCLIIFSMVNHGYLRVIHHRCVPVGTPFAVRQVC